MTSRYIIGIDVGGTFTDVVGIASNGETTLVKASSTLHDQSEGALDGVAKLAEALGLAVAELLACTDRIVHGTTVATNALLEHNGAKVAMLTTEGHRDIIEMREGLKPDRYNLRLSAPELLIPRSRRFEVKERLRDDGRVETALDDESLSLAIAQIRDLDVTAVAICFLHSWRDNAHEQKAAARLAEELPGVFITCSADVLPEIKEFERFNTTAINAFVGPAVSSYLRRLATRLETAGFAGPLFVILSNGGVAPIEEAARLAVATALSGPAGGVSAAVSIARHTGIADIITFDMGGTSTDIAVISNGQAMLGRGRSVGNERIALESLDIVTIGAGGGSIAEIGPGGTLKVGPRSAGAMPGPAAYGNGGTEPTVTDANLVLGNLDPDHFLGGQRKLDLPAAQQAMERLAKRLNISAQATAAGIIELANARMADGIRLATIRRGIDPRGMTLLSFGGAAGMHSAAIAREMGMSKVLVPIFAAGLSAWGMLHTDLRYEASESVMDSDILGDEDRLRAIFARLNVRAAEHMHRWWSGPLTFQYRADMRYGEQVFEINVNLDDLDLDAAGLSERLVAAFHARHKALFTYDLPEEPVMLVNARVAAIGALQEPAKHIKVAGPATTSAPRRRDIFREGMRESLPLYSLEELTSNDLIKGPALVESATTTVLLHHGDAARMINATALEIEVGYPTGR